MMDIDNSKEGYSTPQFRIIEVNIHNCILSGSADTVAVTIGSYTEDTLDW